MGKTLFVLIISSLCCSFGSEIYQIKHQHNEQVVKVFEKTFFRSQKIRYYDRLSITSIGSEWRECCYFTERNGYHAQGCGSKSKPIQDEDIVTTGQESSAGSWQDD